MDFNKELQSRVDYINDTINKMMPEQEGLQQKVIEAANYSINAGGKRIRPMLVLETYRLCNGKDYDIVEPFMVAIECIHTYSLVHDDLPAMDNDDYRRGKLTTHKKFGEDFGVLAGDALLNYAYELIFNAISTQNDPVVIKRMVRAAAVIAKKAGIYGMVGGQSVDVLLTDKPVNETQLEFIFNLKTAALIEASFMAGAILAGGKDDVINELSNAGNKVGFAFQIQDDILDVTGDQKVIGKPVFSDEKNNKTTYVSLYGLTNAANKVTQLSNEAVDIIKTAGENDFLIQLVIKLINREK